MTKAKPTNDPLEGEKDLPEISPADIPKIEKTTREIKGISESQTELKAALMFREQISQIGEALLELNDRMGRMEAQTTTLTEMRKYGDYIKLAIDSLGLTEIEEDVRFKKAGTSEKAIMQWNALALKLQADRESLNNALFEGNMDKYNVLSEKFQEIAKQSGDELAMEYFELRNILDRKHAMQYELGDLSMMLVLLLIRQLGLSQPKALLTELRDLSKKYGDEQTDYIHGV